MTARIKKNDTVVVLSGKDKGLQGTVIEVLPQKGLLMVKGVAVITKHQKARKQNDIAGIKKQEQYLSLSRVMPICSTCNKPCRVQSQVATDGTKARICSRCKKTW